jgi:hypothetical protein
MNSQSSIIKFKNINNDVKMHNVSDMEVLNLSQLSILHNRFSREIKSKRGSDSLFIP